MIALLPGLALAAALAGCDRQKASEPQGNASAAGNASERYPTGILDRSHAGTPAPGVVFQDPYGRPARLSDFRGRPLLVNLWATWCGPCVVEMPSLDALARREGEQVQVLTVSQDMGEEARRRVGDFFAEHRFARLEPYLDPDLRVMTTLRIDTLPTTILYDAEGAEVWRMTGMADWESARATRLLAEGGG